MINAFHVIVCFYAVGVRCPQGVWGCVCVCQRCVYMGCVGSLLLRLALTNIFICGGSIRTHVVCYG